MMAAERKYNDIKSKFPHERKALKQIFAALGKQVELIPNFDLYDPSTSQYLECDLIVVSSVCTAIVELKHWFGEIEVRPYEWFRGPEQTPWTDPHRSNNYKAKVLRGFCRKKLPFIPKDYHFQSIVLLTNPDATVCNADGAKTKKNAPTFDSILTFAKYFKRHLGQPNSKLTVAQAKQIADRLRNEAQSPRRKGLQIPGYEILENLTDSPHLIELLARPTSNQLQTVKRLRIFSVDPTLGQEERENQRNKSRNSLKALTRISDHPNILKVWDIYHEEGLIIEASDWSRKEGTLANVMKKNGPFSLEMALPIIRGIAKGLEAVHQEGIVHRNLSPKNIMMFGTTPKLMNFDLSYLPEDNRLTVLPDDLQLPRSPYLAPELYHHQPFAEATDIFSLGVIAYELLIGAPPFECSTDLISDAQSVYECIESKLAEIGIPESLRTDIVMMIQFQRNDRPQEISELKLELKEIAEETNQEPNRILKLGEIFGVYTIQEWIGKGRDSQVYKALQGSDNWVAIKLYHQDSALDRIFAERDALKAVSNPCIVGYETFNQLADGRYYLVLELVSGDPLRNQIDNSIRPELTLFRHVAFCLMEGIEALHADPARQTIILHNDIKPDNILLKEDGTPVLIDFGASGVPSVGPYMGTDAYVAPDLFQGAEYEFCESGDLFALGVTLFEWLCGVSPYSGTPALTATPRFAASYRKDIPEELSRWLHKAVQPFRAARFQNINEMRDEFDAVFSYEDSVQVTLQTAESAEKWHVYSPEAPPARENAFKTAGDFLDYLNQLHNTTADNRNALAEAQARSRFFGSIHVAWPVTDLVWEKLTGTDGGNIILTGHAGDGKSTICLEIFKRLERKDMSEPLESGLGNHEEKQINGYKIHLIKDLSELPDEKAARALNRAAQGDGRWLIISNTGRLLEVLEALAPAYGLTEIKIGNSLLGLLREKEPTKFKDLGVPFVLINLSQLDNLQIARELFHRLVDNENWGGCRSCDIYAYCPVQMNLKAIRESYEITSERIALIYRLLYEYGKRLTLRQVSAHLAYSLTGGLDCGRIREIAESPKPPPVNAYLFYNRFFGFHGASIDEKAQRLKAIQCLMPIEMGARPFLSLDRVLWTFEEGPTPELPDTLKPVFESLRGMRLSGYGSEAVGARFRQEFRRLFFVFGAFANAGSEKDFVGGFTGSLMLVETESWQCSPTKLTPTRREELKQKVLHVLLEQYTGFYIPETRRGNELFITLNRRNEALRQSVQILLAEIAFSNFELVLEEIYQTFRPQRYHLVLRDRYSPEIHLTLDLPFLDFVLLRSEGELGQRLNLGYLDRLEWFKNLLTARLPSESHEEMRLIQLNHDGKLEQFRVMLSDGFLEIV
ncbi:MAG: protein kinase [Desulfatiglandaceae bacterium]